jgi:hypothetical protein
MNLFKEYKFVFNNKELKGLKIEIYLSKIPILIIYSVSFFKINIRVNNWL